LLHKSDGTQSSLENLLMIRPESFWTMARPLGISDLLESMHASEGKNFWRKMKMSSANNHNRVMTVCRQTGYASSTFAPLLIELLNRLESIEQRLHDAELAKALESK
jgi:hypothetical protein